MIAGATDTAGPERVAREAPDGTEVAGSDRGPRRAALAILSVVVDRSETVAQTNWAGSHVYGAREILHPRSVSEVQEIVARCDRVRVLGSRHSFNAIADSDVLVALDRLPAEIEVDRSAATVSVSAGVTYGVLARALAPEGLALANLASLPHISVAGAVATASHGSGDANGNLATAVAALELVGAGGDRLTVRRGDADFAGFVVGLGALGAVVRVTLDVEPAYRVRQDVFEGMALATLIERFDEVMAAGYSVSAFTCWDGTVDQVWVKRRVAGTGRDRDGDGDGEGDGDGDGDGDAQGAIELPGATAARRDVHPIRGIDPVSATPQLGVPGPWFDRLPHFRVELTPSSGDELQSELLLPREAAGRALRILDALGDRLRPVLRVSEIRTVARDDLWLSPECGRDTVAVHFTWCRQPREVDAVVAEIEAALSPLGARPHWGKVFTAGATALAPLYPRMADFIALVHEHDPRGVFTNAWLNQRVLRR